MYYDSRITDCQSIPKQLWHAIGQLTGRKQFDNIPAELSANDFNEYFSSIGSETAAHLSSAGNETASNGTLFWRVLLRNCVHSDTLARMMFLGLIVNYYLRVLI